MVDARGAKRAGSEAGGRCPGAKRAGSGGRCGAGKCVRKMSCSVRRVLGRVRGWMLRTANPGVSPDRASKVAWQEYGEDRHGT